MNHSLILHQAILLNVSEEEAQQWVKAFEAQRATKTDLLLIKAEIDRLRLEAQTDLLKLRSDLVDLKSRVHSIEARLSNTRFF